MKIIRILAAIFLFATATSAFADSQQKQYDESFGTANGFRSCTSTVGCLACANDAMTGRAVCVNQNGTNGACKCTIVTSTASDGSERRTCGSYGQCTYQP
jgi:predicted hotdog family 3-hydroxylacyl-ACP dehydratase